MLRKITPESVAHTLQEAAAARESRWQPDERAVSSAWRVAVGATGSREQPPDGFVQQVLDLLRKR